MIGILRDLLKYNVEFRIGLLLVTIVFGLSVLSFFSPYPPNDVYVVPPDIPPPQVGVKITEADFSGRGREGGRADGVAGAPTRSDLEQAPVFTPMTVRPELLNSDEVARALVRGYPPLLRDAGIGGTPVVWFFIDETGRVVKTQLSKSSGHASLDEAAIKVSQLMRFSPALNRDQKVAVWVEIPIVYRVN